MLHILRRIKKHLFKARIDRELDAEMRFHLEMETEKNIRRGMSEEEARLAAQRSFGGLQQVKESYRDASRFRWLEEIWEDLRYGGRMRAERRGIGWYSVQELSA